MLVDIYLTDTETGFSKVYHDNYDWGNGEGLIFQYTENNCDCNLSLFLYDWDENDKKPCGNTIRLDKIVDRKTGQAIWDGATQAKEDEQIRIKVNLSQKFGMHFI
jgi:hypothetical protein